VNGHSSLGQPGLLVGETYGILGLPKRDGRKRPDPMPIPTGEGGFHFLSFHDGRWPQPVGSSPPGVWCCWFGKVQVALFSVIALALFSVITLWARLAKWPSFRLSRGLIFGYRTQPTPDSES
jgi:hypothetical protein